MVFIDLIVTVPDVVEVFFFDADPVIGDFKPDRLIFQKDLDTQFVVFADEFDRIGQIVENDLLDLDLIRIDRNGIRSQEFDLAIIGHDQRIHEFDDIIGQRDQIKV